jgi:transcriptional regulator with GAF, ATPase, and Fis domain
VAATSGDSRWIGGAGPVATYLVRAYRSRMGHAPDEAVAAAEAFGEVARSLATPGDLATILDTIVRLAVDHLAACEYAGISFVEKRTITSPASSHEVPRILDAIQSETGEGPCIDAIKEHEVFLTGDLRREERWPRFSTRAHAETGVSSVASLRLFVDDKTMGALNLYSRALDAFDDTDVALGAVFAVHAAVALSAAEREGMLERKAQSRDVIGQAKGILMARSGATDEEAFAVLKAASQRLNLKLRDVAERVAHQKPPQQPPAA